MTGCRWLPSAPLGVFLLTLAAASFGCELIAGTRDRQPVLGPVGAGSESAGNAGTGGSGGGGGAGANPAPNPWPDSATRFCSNGVSEVGCPTPEGTNYAGQDGDSEIHVPSYTWNGNQLDPTLTDSVTGLEWEADSVLVVGTPYQWQEAFDQCELLNRFPAYDGHEDWRLPSRRELASLIDAGHPKVLSETSSLFPKELDALRDDGPDKAKLHYWTSVESKSSPAEAWAMFLMSIDSGMVSIDKRSTGYEGHGRALCVRGSKDYNGLNVESRGEIVRDPLTFLEWQSGVSEAEMTWVDALKYCKERSLNNGQGGFRLPTIKELLYLVEDSQAQPAINAMAFPGTPAEIFWSSSPSAARATDVWTIDFGFGKQVAVSLQGNPAHWVRCVR